MMHVMTAIVKSATFLLLLKNLRCSVMKRRSTSQARMNVTTVSEMSSDAC